MPGGEFPVWFFSAAGETIWGATARVLTELLCLVLGVAGPARPGGAEPAAGRRTGRRTRLRPPCPGGIVGDGRCGQCRSCHRLGGTSNCNQGPEGNSVAELEIGIFKSGRRAYGFDDIAIVPSRRTRDPEDVDISLADRRLPVRAAPHGLGHGRGGQPRHRHRDRPPRRPRRPQPRGTVDPLRGPDQALRRDPRAADREGHRPDAADVRRAGPAGAGHPADQGDEGRRHHHRRLGHPAEDPGVRRRPCSPPSSTSWSSRAPSCRPSTSPRRPSPSTSSASSASSRSR